MIHKERRRGKMGNSYRGLDGWMSTRVPNDPRTVGRPMAPNRWRNVERRPCPAARPSGSIGTCTNGSAAGPRPNRDGPARRWRWCASPDWRPASGWANGRPRASPATTTCTERPAKAVWPADGSCVCGRPRTRSTCPPRSACPANP